ncbi:MAG: hypothetical protein E7404_05565 [Ruminococcaceae bacterium]|nr:hypothetical protein [Oscillospiraceae bacterium]
MIFKPVLIIVDFLLSIMLFILAKKSMKTDHLKFGGSDFTKKKEYKSSFNKCFWMGIGIKFLYWLIIPDINNKIASMINFGIIMCLAIDFFAIIYLFPMHLIKKDKYQKCSPASSAEWLIRSTGCIILLYILAYLISAPVMM